MSRHSSSSSALISSGFRGLVVVLGAIVSVVGPVLYAQEDTAGAISREVKSIFERCGRAVVKIHAVDEHSELSGTGFFVDPAGTIYTSYSVGGEADNFPAIKSAPQSPEDKTSARIGLQVKASGNIVPP